MKNVISLLIQNELFEIIDDLCLIPSHLKKFIPFKARQCQSVLSTKKTRHPQYVVGIDDDAGCNQKVTLQFGRNINRLTTQFALM